MSKYTTELRQFIESFSHDQMTFPMSHAEKIEIGRTKLFDFQYPIFDETYRKVFETHFIRKFYMREIGFETMGLFKFQLETWLLINMPYFNKLFESEMLTYNPLFNVDMNTTKNKTTDKTQSDTRDVVQSSTTGGTSNSTTSQITDNTATSVNDTDSTITNDHFDRQLESNNPDSRLAITTNDGQGVIEYASNIKENTDNNTQTTNVLSNVTNNSNTTDEATNDTTTNVNSNANQNDVLTSDINETEDFIEHTVGKTGTKTYPEMVAEYRESFLRIENRIFEEMQELFMLVY